MGKSDKPLLRYTTSEMAKDIVELLDHVGWTGKRSIHVVGISMGGMISQELVRCLHPDPLHRSLMCPSRRPFRYQTESAVLTSYLRHLALFEPSLLSRISRIDSS